MCVFKGRIGILSTIILRECDCRSPTWDNTWKHKAFWWPAILNQGWRSLQNQRGKWWYQSWSWTVERKKKEDEDPLFITAKICKWFQLNSAPPFRYFSTSHIQFDAAGYDKRGLAAYKAFDDYRLLEERYVQSLLIKPLPSVGQQTFLEKFDSYEEVSDTQKKAFYNVWFNLENKSATRGSRFKAKCTCKGGRDGECKHTSAALCFAGRLVEHTI